MKRLMHFLFACLVVSSVVTLSAQSKLNPNLLLRGSFDNSQLLFAKEKKGHVAFMGGSITEMNGYRPIMMEWLEKRFPDTAFTFTNAGISSTCSTTGAFRLKRDILDKGPVDLFFVEFAVNDDQDAGHSREACLRGMEGIIRHLRAHNPNADVVVTYFVNPGMLKTLQGGKTPLPMGAHEEVLRYYDVSAVHLAKEVADRINAGTFSWKTFGGTHPKRPGNALCAELIGQMLHHAWQVAPKNPSAKATVPHPLPEKLLHPNSYVKGRFLSPENVKLDVGWKWREPNWKKLSGGKRGRYLGFPLLHTEKPGSTITIDFEGTAIGAFVLAGPDAGILDFEVDGKTKGTVNLRHHYSRGLHYPRTVMFAYDLDPGKHNLRLTLSAKPNSTGKITAARILEFCVN